MFNDQMYVSPNIGQEHVFHGSSINHFGVIALHDVWDDWVVTTAHNAFYNSISEFISNIIIVADRWEISSIRLADKLS